MQAYQGLDILADAVPDSAYFSQTLRIKWWHNAKSVVRPLNVVTQHVHQPLKIVPGVDSNGKWVEPTIAAIKHMRCNTASAV